MKKLFIPAKSRLKISLHKSNLPKNFAIVYSIQFKEQAEKIKEFLSSAYNITEFIQVLGCSQPKFSKTTQAILLIGQGKFHAVSLAYETKLPVFILENNKVTKISEEKIKKFNEKKKASLMKFLSSNKIGILVSTKPGQENLKKAIDFQKNSKKNSYLFIGNELNVSEFENFPEIQSWVNTACTRMDLNSSKIINLNEIKE